MIECQMARCSSEVISIYFIDILMFQIYLKNWSNVHWWSTINKANSTIGVFEMITALWSMDEMWLFLNGYIWLKTENMMCEKICYRSLNLNSNDWTKPVHAECQAKNHQTKLNVSIKILSIQFRITIFPRFRRESFQSILVTVHKIWETINSLYDRRQWQWVILCHTQDDHHRHWKERDVHSA